MPQAFHIGVLLYGDYPDLAEQCLRSIWETANWDVIADIRIGLNAIGHATRLRLCDIALAERFERPVFIYQETEGQNVGKYPLMRRMLYGQVEQPLLTAPYWMWFDDDSYIATERFCQNMELVPETLRQEGRAWWSRVAEIMKNTDLLGSPYSLKCPFKPWQRVAISRMPWYANKSVTERHKPTFVTGGWWVARIEKLQRWNYPFPEIHHNGGDSILGELARQQNWTTTKFNEGIAINAGKTGRESGAKRRGITTPWPWEVVSLDGAPLPHHNFNHSCLSLKDFCLATTLKLGQAFTKKAG
jgi:hypothetical protein